MQGPCACAEHRTVLASVFPVFPELSLRSSHAPRHCAQRAEAALHPADGDGRPQRIRITSLEKELHSAWTGALCERDEAGTPNPAGRSLGSLWRPAAAALSSQRTTQPSAMQSHHLHSARLWVTRVLSAPVVAADMIWKAIKQRRQRSGPLLPVHSSDDSQGKLIGAKSRTMIQDLLCFGAFMLCALLLLRATWPSAADAMADELVAPATPGLELASVVTISSEQDQRRDNGEADNMQPHQLQEEADRSGLNAQQADDIRTPSTSVAATPSASAVAVNEYRRQQVRQAFLHAWSGYERYAWGHDEIRPVTNATNDSWGGWGATLVDGLDSAMLMGLDEQVAKARIHVAGINFSTDRSSSFFETTIRYLGGLLGAYEISRDLLYLTKATELADLLVAGFDSTPTGLPKSKINLAKHTSENNRWTQGDSILAEVGSIQLEFEYLSFHTGNPIYAQKARKVIDVLDEAPKRVAGLYPTYIDPATGQFSNHHISFGSFGDSFYEYLLKVYLLTDRRDQRSLRMWNEAMSAMEQRMILTQTVIYEDDLTHKPVQKEFAFLGEMSILHEDGQGDDVGSSGYKHKQEHLTCFVPGLLALGVSLVADDTLASQTGIAPVLMASGASNAVMLHDHARTVRPQGVETGESVSPPAPGQLSEQELVLRNSALGHTRTATALLNTCVASYMATTTGLAPESIDFDPRHMDKPVGGARHKLPPRKPQPSTPKKRGKNSRALLGSEEDEASYENALDSFDPAPPAVDPASEVLNVGPESALLGRLFKIDQTKYILRPETLESLFVLYRLTGDESYRDQGWRIFQNLVRSCKTPAAFSGLKDVNAELPTAPAGSDGRPKLKRKAGLRGRVRADSEDSGAVPMTPRAMQESLTEDFSFPENWTNSQESFFFGQRRRTAGQRGATAACLICFSRCVYLVLCAFS